MFVVIKIYNICFVSNCTHIDIKPVVFELDTSMYQKLNGFPELYVKTEIYGLRALSNKKQIEMKKLYQELQQKQNELQIVNAM